MHLASLHANYMRRHLTLRDLIILIIFGEKNKITKLRITQFSLALLLLPSSIYVPYLAACSGTPSDQVLLLV
jgi:hypothetical protein